MKVRKLKMKVWMMVSVGEVVNEHKLAERFKVLVKSKVVVNVKVKIFFEVNKVVSFNITF